MAYNLKKIVNSIKKDFSTVNVSSEIPDPTDFISTGNKAADLMLDGGIAFGYVTEFAGLSGSGKTLMLQKIAANAQKAYDAIVLWADRENAFTNKRAEELGINVDNVILAKPVDIPTVKDLENFLKSTIKKIREDYPEAYVSVVVDSVSSFSSGSTGEDMGRKAKHLHSLFRELMPLLDTKISMQLANQVTFNPSIMFGNNKTTTGGEALKYYSTYRLLLDEKNLIKNNDETIGTWLEFYVVKTRMGPSYRKVILPHYFKGDIPELGGYIRMLAERGIVQPKNKADFAKFKTKLVAYKDKQYKEDNPEKLLAEHPELNLSEWLEKE